MHTIEEHPLTPEHYQNARRFIDLLKTPTSLLADIDITVASISGDDFDQHEMMIREQMKHDQRKVALLIAELDMADIQTAEFTRVMLMLYGDDGDDLVNTTLILTTLAEQHSGKRINTDSVRSNPFLDFKKLLRGDNPNQKVPQLQQNLIIEFR